MTESNSVLSTMKNQIALKGYMPGAIGQITALHGQYYSQHRGWGLAFEAEVATELSTFLSRFDPAADGFWTAVLADSIVGSIAIDGSQAKTAGARLRWFIVAPNCQGYGIGRLLMHTAIDFCRQAQFDRVYLWTAPGLLAAHHLYRQYGFEIVEELVDGHWGSQVVHQKLVLHL